jgi:hypothetical protein
VPFKNLAVSQDIPGCGGQSLGPSRITAQVSTGPWIGG